MIPSIIPMAHLSSNRPILVILGPTASGKTDLAVAIAEGLVPNGECIIADSMQIYRGMDVGTASPSPESTARVPHHLLDVADPTEDGFTVAEFARRATAAIDSIRGRNGWPIVVGGTNLYIRAILEGLFEGPASDEAIRGELTALGPAQRRAMLEACDPPAAERIHPNDHRRTIRAIEVFRLTGQPISALQRQWADAFTPRSDALLIGLEWPVEALNLRINERVRAMMKAGFHEEVRRLSTLKPNGLGAQAREAVGYRELLATLEGSMSLEDATEQIKIRSRRYAKQQRTWLRRFKAVPGSLWMAAEGRATEDLAAEALGWIGQQEPFLTISPEPS